MAKIDTIVVLTVDVENINSGNIKESIVFSDTRNDIEVAGDPDDFDSFVDSGKKITWCAIVKPSDNSPNYKVGVYSVSKKTVAGGVDILKQENYGDSNSDGIVVGSIRNNKIPGDENYNLSIKTWKKVNGSWTGPFEFDIDPKLRMNN